jgi:Effector Associated Constant Component 1
MHEDYVPAEVASIPQDGFVIEFPDANKREAGDNAKDLKVVLDNAAADAGIASGVRLEKTDPNAQDPGTILAVILGAKASIALATGIALWMRRRNQARIRIRYPDGTEADIIGAESRDVSKIAQALNRTLPTQTPKSQKK